jgi:hypothetical protein
MPIKLSSSSFIVASNPTSPNSFIPLLKPYCGVDLEASKLVNDAMVFSTYLHVECALIPQYPSGLKLLSRPVGLSSFTPEFGLQLSSTLSPTPGFGSGLGSGSGSGTGSDG